MQNSNLERIPHQSHNRVDAAFQFGALLLNRALLLVDRHNGPRPQHNALLSSTCEATPNGLIYNFFRKNIPNFFYFIFRIGSFESRLKASKSTLDRFDRFCKWLHLSGQMKLIFSVKASFKKLSETDIC